MSYAARIARRHTPDAGQVQVVLGALLGRGRLVAEGGDMHLVIVLGERHAWLADWTYRRIAPLAPSPLRTHGRILLRSVPHPLFAELDGVLAQPRRLLAALGREALWVWAMYARVGGCERSAPASCACVPATPPPPRTARRAS